ncbi:hypothetical protein JTB14_033512 [Gonioctena quinquepunctata]|nr:hypothetical protein JTB14_033512 [Gonioctena quinquepunctata]
MSNPELDFCFLDILEKPDNENQEIDDSHIIEKLTDDGNHTPHHTQTTVPETQEKKEVREISSEPEKDVEILRRSRGIRKSVERYNL